MRSRVKKKRPMKNKPFEIPKLIIVKPMKNRLKEDRVVWPHYDEYSDPRGFHADYLGDFFFYTNEPKLNPDGTIKEVNPE